MVIFFIGLAAPISNQSWKALNNYHADNYSHNFEDHHHTWTTTPHRRLCSMHSRPHIMNNHGSIDILTRHTGSRPRCKPNLNFGSEKHTYESLMHSHPPHSSKYWAASSLWAWSNPRAEVVDSVTECNRRWWCRSVYPRDARLAMAQLGQIGRGTTRPGTTWDKPSPDRPCMAQPGQGSATTASPTQRGSRSARPHGRGRRSVLQLPCC